jgi:hypothetical protein
VAFTIFTVTTGEWHFTESFHFYPYGAENAESRAIAHPYLLRTVSLSWYRFSRNSYLMHGVTLIPSLPNFVKIGQEVWNIEWKFIHPLSNV